MANENTEQKVISRKRNAGIAHPSIEELEKQYLIDTYKTIEKSALSILKNIRTFNELSRTIDSLEDSWKVWTDSLFRIEYDSDIDAYGNLYSLQILCRTLLLASQDAYRLNPSTKTEILLERIKLLDRKCDALTQPIAAILHHHGNNPFLDYRMEIMQREFSLVSFFYNLHPFRPGF